jgi:hypothetical protein
MPLSDDEIKSALTAARALVDEGLPLSARILDEPQLADRMALRAAALPVVLSVLLGRG